jgi:4-hydroxy-tetrahydrodipicolinate synthase
MAKTRKEKLVGVVASLPSFCDDDYNLLLDRQRKHIRWLIDHGLKEGSAVLMISGGLGEGYFLDDDEWRAMADVLAVEARGEVATMIGVFELSARRAAKKAKYAADAGIDFVQLAPPHYMVPSENDVYGHYKYVNDNADVGIMAYNIPWAMPKPGFEFTARLLERFAELENVVGVKWSSHDIRHYLGMLRLFSDRFNFIDNMMIFSLGFRLGMKGFINFHANVAPRLALKYWELLQQKKYDEFDEIYLKMRFDPFLKVVRPEEQAWVGVGEGPTSRLTLRALGMEAGPAFPAQTEPPQEYLERARSAIEAGGIHEWVEWDQSIFD